MPSFKTFKFGFISGAVLVLACVGYIYYIPAANTVSAPAAATTNVATSVGMSFERLSRIRPIFQKHIDDNKIAGAQILVARKGQIVHFSSVGYQNIENKTPIDENTLFRIYSMTKPVTSVALMMLYEEGKFQLNDPLHKYIPEFKDLVVYVGEDDEGNMITEPAKRAPTIQDLMRHTAGFTYGVFGDTAVDKQYRKANMLDYDSDLKAMITKVSKIPLMYQPGEKWVYSISADIQGYLIERLSDQSFPDFLRTKLFNPLGMDDTSFWVDANKAPRLMTSYSYDEEGKLALTPPHVTGAVDNFYHKPTGYFGGSGLISSTKDFWRFAQMVASGGSFEGQRYLSPKTIDYMRQNHLTDELTNPYFKGSGFGLGFGVLTDPIQNGSLTSKGSYFWGGLASTLFWIDPEEDIVAILMTQQLPTEKILRRDLQTMVYQALEK